MTKILLTLVTVMGFTIVAQAKGHGRGGHHDGPCKHIQCDAAGTDKDKCREEKKQCISKFMDEKLAEAEKNGISAERKTKLVDRMEKRISKKEAKGATEAELAPIKEKLEKVKALEEKK